MWWLFPCRKDNLQNTADKGYQHRGSIRISYQVPDWAKFLFVHEYMAAQSLQLEQLPFLLPNWSISRQMLFCTKLATAAVCRSLGAIIVNSADMRADGIETPNLSRTIFQPIFKMLPIENGAKHLAYSNTNQKVNKARQISRRLKHKKKNNQAVGECRKTPS